MILQQTSLPSSSPLPPNSIPSLCVYSLPAAMHVARSFRHSPSVLVDQKLVGFLSPLRYSSASVLCCMASELEPAKKLMKILAYFVSYMHETHCGLMS